MEGEQEHEPIERHSYRDLPCQRPSSIYRLCWLLVASVGQNRPVRTPPAVSCSLPIPQRKSTIASMHPLILTKGNVSSAQDSHLRHRVDRCLSSVSALPFRCLDHTEHYLATTRDTDRP